MSKWHAPVLLLLSLASVKVHGWIAATPPHVASRNHARVSLLRMQASSTGQVPDLKGKAVYQRIIHRLSSKSDVELHNDFSVEERVRFRPMEDGGYMEPYGHRTLILRGPPSDSKNVVGPELYRLDVHEASSSHKGAGNDLSMESAICTILYLASNPDLLVGNVMDLQCDLGLGGLLGSIAAGFTQQAKGDSPQGNNKNEVDLLIRKDSPLPSSMRSLVLVDNNEDMLNLAFANVKNSNLSPSKVDVQEMDWTHYHRRSSKAKKYHLVLATDIYLSYPSAKALARTVAYSLEPLPWEETNRPARFVLFYRENDDDVVYLKRFLTKGYRMSLDVGYLKLQKLFLQPSIVDATMQENEKMETTLKADVHSAKESTFECLTALHHPDYSGDNGDFFFPMENGAFDGGGSDQTSLEQETARGPW